MVYGFGDRLKGAIKKKNINYVQLSKRTGIDRKTIMNYCNNQSSPTGCAYLMRLCRELNVSADYLLGLKEE